MWHRVPRAHQGPTYQVLLVVQPGAHKLATCSFIPPCIHRGVRIRVGGFPVRTAFHQVAASVPRAAGTAFHGNIWPSPGCPLGQVALVSVPGTWFRTGHDGRMLRWMRTENVLNFSSSLFYFCNLYCTRPWK